MKPRHEKAASAALLAKGYEQFVPLENSRRRWSDRIKEVSLPLFPGYVFCRFDQAQRAPVLSTPGVRSIVGFGKNLAPVDDEEIATLRRIADAGLPVVPTAYLNVGERVVIDQGSLTGVEGILLSIKGERRLIVSVTLLQRSVAVEIDGSWVRAAPRRAAAS